MPELPEVETTRRGIEPPLQGREITAIAVRNARLRLPVPADELERALSGQTLLAVRRRAKYLLLDFAHGSVIIHLGMSGSLRVVEAVEAPQKHDHVDLLFGEKALRYRDPRRFGMVLWHGGDALRHPLLAQLGPEPLQEGFDAHYLLRSLYGVRVPVKQALMDARRVVGVGNIYASECLFRARVHPLTPAQELGLARCRRIVAALRETLQAAIAAGGSTLRDFVGGDGKPGYFQQQYFVYGREHEPCGICGKTVKRTVTGQRSTYWCPGCQRR